MSSYKRVVKPIYISTGRESEALLFKRKQVPYHLSEIKLKVLHMENGKVEYQR